MGDRRIQYIVTGVSTAGKSRFASGLVQRWAVEHASVEHIGVDSIIEAFEDVMPELGITHRAEGLEEHLEVCRRFGPFAARMAQGLRTTNFVLEGFRLPLEYMVEQCPWARFAVFGFPRATAEERLALCRLHDTDNWTNDMSDEDLLPWLRFFVEESLRLEDICGSLGVPFYDTGSDDDGALARAWSDAAVCPP